MKKYWILATALLLIVVGVVLHFTTGNAFASGDYALGFFAAGNFACGIFAAGNFSIGVFSVGLFSIGIFSLSVFNIGIYALGFFVYKWNHEKLAFVSNAKQFKDE